MICPDILKWWKVDILNDVAPRTNAKMRFVDGRLYVFGGLGHELFDIAEFDDGTEKWTWVVRDEPYPPHIPRFGVGGNGNVVPVHGGQCYSHYPASHIVLFDIATQTFQKYNDVKGEFPTKIYGMNSIVITNNRLLDGRLCAKPKPEPEDGSSSSSEGTLNACTSVVMATWHDDKDTGDATDDASFESSSPLRDMPELWILNLSTTYPSERTRLDLRKSESESRKITVACCDAIADRQILLLGSLSSDADDAFMDRCIEIELGLGF
ncbi:hypothetical protein C0995_010774 [Termitomyces sp. Mi166|nr:hypothetical protein C0995_010774 [Termitomyces sp. Mi166\